MTLSQPYPASRSPPRSAGTWLLLNLLVLIAYSVLGVIILFFGIGPAKIIPIYPPAGIAVAPAAAEVPAWPDLVLIDGGLGQLQAARQVLAEIGVGDNDVALIGIAKGRDRDAGRETFFRPGQPAFKLPPRDPALYFVQRLRDELRPRARRRRRSRVYPPAGTATGKMKPAGDDDVRTHGDGS